MLREELYLEDISGLEQLAVTELALACPSSTQI